MIENPYLVAAVVQRHCRQMEPTPLEVDWDEYEGLVERALRDDPWRDFDHLSLLHRLERGILALPEPGMTDLLT